MNEDDEVVRAFLDESRESLGQLDRDLVELEARPSDAELLARVFRTVHTVKGTCGFLGYERLEALAHAGENVLGALRDGSLTLDAEVTTSLLRLVDAVRSVLARIETTGHEGDDDHAALIAGLDRHVASGARAAAPTRGAASTVPGATEAAMGRTEPTATTGPAPTVTVSREPGAAPTATATASRETVPAPAAAALGSAEGPAAETSVRVDVVVLDELRDLVGELVLTRAQISEVAPVEEDGPLADAYRRLRLVTDALQDGVTRARLQPLGTVLATFPRVARDVAASLGKKVVVEVEGGDVGVDRAVNEALRDPLLHLVRNAVDHGIEPPGQRLLAGKPAEGRLRIRAWHEGGRVRIEVSDDGAGIDTGRLVARAVSTGVLTPEAAARLGRREALALVFQAGVSTKGEVTTVSGRGIGMDVARAGVARIGGGIEVSSGAGSGTRFHIDVPLTLAVLPCVVVAGGGQRYAVPQVDVREVVHVDAGEMGTGAGEAGGARLLRVRGRALPLVELCERLGVASTRAEGGADVLVVERAAGRFGLVVDRVHDTTDAVVQPLPRAVRSVPLFTGVSLLADGRPALILDVAHLLGTIGIRARPEAEEADRPPGPHVGPPSLLVATCAGGSRLAVPLGVVQRVEKVAAARVERDGAREVVRDGQERLPLVRRPGAVGGSGAPPPPAGAGEDGEELTVVVCATSAGRVGLVVDDADVGHWPAPPARQPHRPGGADPVVVEGRPTEVLDVETLVTGGAGATA